VDKDFIENNVKKIFSNTTKEEVSSNQNQSFAQQLKSKYSFTVMHNKIVSSVMNQIISWIIACFNKYSEKDFHEKMRKGYTFQDGLTGAIYPMYGFDFIEDWKANHKNTFDIIIPTMRKFKVQINKEELHGLTLQALRKQGWMITEQETKALKVTITRLCNILYKDVDSISL